MRGFDFEHPDPLVDRVRAPVEEHGPARDAGAAVARRSDVLGRAGMIALQRSAGNSAVASLAEEQASASGHERSPVLDVVSSGGSPLDSEVRGDMESRLGADFGDVRVHTDDTAHRSAQAVNANAYTVGHNVVFQRDRYDPSSTQGRTTLAHELTHVIQQRSGPVEGTPTGGGVSVSNPSDRFEQAAAANAERAMSTAPPTAQLEAVDAPTLQREEAQEEEAPVQGDFVQREEADDEEPAG